MNITINIIAAIIIAYTLIFKAPQMREYNKKYMEQKTKEWKDKHNSHQ